MSLIIDLLNKLGPSRKKSGVHPALSKRKERNTLRSKKALLLLTPLIILSFTTAFFLTRLLLDRPVAIPPPRADIPKPRGPEKLTTQEPAPQSQEQAVGNMAEEEEESPEEKRPIEVVKKPVKTNTSTSENDIEKVMGDLKSRDEERGGTESTDITTLLVQAHREFRRGNLLKSAKLYEEALKHRRNDKAVNNLVLIYIRLGELEKARRLIESNRREEILYTYLMELVRKGKLKEVLSESERFLPIDRKGYVLFSRGYVYESLGEYELAMENYRMAFRKNPNNAYFGFNYGRMLEALGLLREAKEVYSLIYSEELDENLRSAISERLKYLKFMGF